MTTDALTTAPATPSRTYLLRGLVGALALWFFDQLSKWWVFESQLRVKGDARTFADWLSQPRHFGEYGDPSDFAEKIIAPFANFVMVWNRGVSFGMFASDDPSNRLALMAVAGLIVLGLGLWLARARDSWIAAALSLVIGGAVANMHDRLRFGAVADFLDLHVNGWHWPAFNLADSAIVIGAVLLALDALNIRPPRAGEAPTNGDAT